ncbi:MAG: FHIPEP family type III secretion protein, partial [Brevinematia bacterium]
YTKNPEVITENVRQALAKQIAKKYADSTNTLTVITLDPELEDKLASYIRETESGFIYAVPPNLLRDFLNVLSEKVKNMVERGKTPIVLCSTRIRRLIKEVTVRMYKNLVVMSYNEVVPPFGVEQFDYVSVNLVSAEAEV